MPKELVREQLKIILWPSHLSLARRIGQWLLQAHTYPNGVICHLEGNVIMDALAQ